MRALVAFGLMAPQHASPQRPRVTVTLPGFRLPVVMDTVGTAREYPASAGRVFAAVAEAMRSLGLAADVRDSVAGVLGSLGLKVSRRWAGQQMSRSLDCGVGIRGLNADVYRVHLAFVNLVTPLGADRASLRVTLAAGAQDFAGPLADHVSCSSTGGYEDRVHALVHTALTKPDEATAMSRPEGAVAMAAPERAAAASGDGISLRDADAVLRDAAAPDSFLVRFETTQGAFVARARRALAPNGVDRFYALVRHRFFDGQRFFRVRAGFIAQFGLHPDPAVIAAWKPRTMPDDPPRTKNKRGWLAYAFTTAHSRSTQIFVSLADNATLDAEPFAPFAEIVEGVGVIDKLYSGYDESAGGGMRGGKQGPIEAEGEPYFARAFPRLDVIVRARVVPESGS